ncbi:MAG TPA: hypothetical protein P5114_05100 [Hyphomicrobiaceae bacterium]|nr:hypothetical protein [Hyphomicrobiaceae bacterium]
MNLGNRFLSSLLGIQVVHSKKIERLKQQAQPGSSIDQNESRECRAFLSDIRELTLSFQNMQEQKSHPNPLNQFGHKCYSQSDEDGITIEILNRIGLLENGVFAEFGVGNGMENNTLVLKSLGWKGFWVGGEDLAFDIPQSNGTFSFQKEWINRSNICEFAKRGMLHIHATEIDLISLDLDGNDIYLCEELLKNGFVPKVFIVEYNAKFLPPIKFQIEYDPDHVWNEDDYFGASLASFNELFNRYGFKLVCCNSHTGANAFFVREELMDCFIDVPADIRNIFVGPRYYLHRSYGHRPSTKTISTLLKQKQG